MRNPAPDIRSSGSEYPMKPSRMARISIVRPMGQFRLDAVCGVTGEEDAAHVDLMIDAVRGLGRPVVHLADEEASSHVEGDVYCRLVGGRHPLGSGQRHVGAVGRVQDPVRRRDEEERQETPVASTTTNE